MLGSFDQVLPMFGEKIDSFFQNVEFGAVQEVRKSCRSQKNTAKSLFTLLLAKKIGFDTTENEPSRVICIHLDIPQMSNQNMI